MSQIKPSEVSEILKQQIDGFNSAVELEEVGTVLQVGDGIARIYGLSKVQSGELIEFSNGVEGIVLNLEEDNVGAVLFGEADKVKEGDEVRRTSRIASINVSEDMLGRVIDPLGNPIDGQGPFTGEKFEMPQGGRGFGGGFGGGPGAAPDPRCAARRSGRGRLRQGGRRRPGTGGGRGLPEHHPPRLRR